MLSGKFQPANPLQYGLQVVMHQQLCPLLCTMSLGLFANLQDLMPQHTVCSLNRMHQALEAAWNLCGSHMEPMWKLHGSNVEDYNKLHA